MNDSTSIAPLYPIYIRKLIYFENPELEETERKTHPWYEDLQEYTERYYDEDTFDFCAHQPF